MNAKSNRKSKVSKSIKQARKANHAPKSKAPAHDSKSRPYGLKFGWQGKGDNLGERVKFFSTESRRFRFANRIVGHPRCQGLVSYTTGANQHWRSVMDTDGKLPEPKLTGKEAAQAKAKSKRQAIKDKRVAERQARTLARDTRKFLHYRLVMKPLTKRMSGQLPRTAKFYFDGPAAFTKEHLSILQEYNDRFSLAVKGMKIKDGILFTSWLPAKARRQLGAFALALMVGQGHYGISTPVVSDKA